MPIRAGHVLRERYQLTERIAVGGMGEVWRACDLLTGRTVAAKVLREDLIGDAGSLARLRAEARNAGGVVHRNVAAVLDHGEQDGAGFLVMEHVVGEPLSALLGREDALEADRLLPTLTQCARGLHAVHQAGVVHRDVKPSNVLLAPDGTVKLTDFGISLGAHQPALTAAGMVMGTAQYLAPELAMGKPARPAADIYALGIIAYEALAGRRPFTGTNQVDIAMAHVTKPLPPLPAHVPEPVRALVAEMLAKDPSARPSSAELVALRMEQLVSDDGGTRRGGLPPGGGPAPGAAADPGDRQRQRPVRRWQWPRWAELAADRRRLPAVRVGAVPAVVLTLTLGTLALGGVESASSDPETRPADRPTVRNH